MEDIYNIQISATLNSHIFTQFKELSNRISSVHRQVGGLGRAIGGISRPMRQVSLSSDRMAERFSRNIRSMRSEAASFGRSFGRGGGGFFGGVPFFVGGMGAFLGYSAARLAGRGVMGTVESASELQNRALQFRMMNLPKSERGAIDQAIRKTSHRVMGTTLSGNTELARDLTTVLGAGRTGSVIQDLPAFAKFQTTYKKIYGEASSRMMTDAMRFLEHIPGVLDDPRLLRTEMEKLFKVRALGRLVNPSNFFQAMQTGKMALTLSNDSFRFGAFASLMTGKSGYTLGTQAMSSYYALAGGHMQRQTAAWLQSLGLLRPLDATGASMRTAIEGSVDPYIRASFSRTGIGGSIGRQIKDLDLFVRNPYEWSKKDLVPAIMKKHGWKHLSRHRKDVAEEEARFFSQRNVSDFMGQMVVRQQAIDRDIRLIGQSVGLSDAYGMANKTFAGSVENFKAAVKNFGADIGKGAIHTATGALNFLSKAIYPGGPKTKFLNLPSMAAIDLMVNQGLISRSDATSARNAIAASHQQEIVLHIPIYLNGKKITDHTSRQLVDRHKHPTSASSYNGAIFPMTNGQH